MKNTFLAGALAVLSISSTSATTYSYEIRYTSSDTAVQQKLNACRKAEPVGAISTTEISNKAYNPYDESCIARIKAEYPEKIRKQTIRKRDGKIISGEDAIISDAGVILFQ